MTNVTVANKSCRKCGQTKPSEEFRFNSKVSDGLSSWCRKCHYEASRRSQAKKPEQYARRAREWYRKQNPLEPRECRWCATTFMPPSLRHFYCSEGCVDEGAHFLNKYGMDKADYDELLASQGYRCAICRVDSHEWNVDHDHETGEVRGILCRSCNHGIGFLRDDPETVRAAALYLDRHRQAQFQFDE